jgi:hypothetical protein
MFLARRPENVYFLDKDNFLIKAINALHSNYLKIRGKRYGNTRG